MPMIKTARITFLTLLATSVFGQENTLPKALGQVDSTNLPVQKIGKEDLLNVQIIDLPELSRSYRVTNNGQIRMPMLKQMINVEGLYPADIEVLIADELKHEELMVDPFVSVSVTEYHSRPISVTGAVKNPTVFQAIRGTCKPAGRHIAKSRGSL